MKINDNNEIFANVRFGNLEPGKEFAIREYYPDGSDGFAFLIKGNGDYDDSIKGWAVDLSNGVRKFFDDFDFVIPIEIEANVIWPNKYIKRK